ncbi:MAG: Protein of unknown function (DUF1587)/Protein of unknown function (DUF1592)/Protein of unknown [Verrucomicrobiales bacterium]|nr:Protein of unknown function (DUF1587)/Protein of unknown function (DUF1592)/Protein of unknown [Verrucomicrobiales bacterium]
MSQLVCGVLMAISCVFPARGAFDSEVHPLLEKYCFKCHAGEKIKGGVDLSKYHAELDIQRDPKTWQTVLRQVREREMPPENKPQPTDEERQLLVAFTKHTLENIDYSKSVRDPGRVLIHRLSRTEYNNTIRDLCGVDLKPADKFPADGGGGGGFDNNADTLFVPPILLEKYLSAASEVIDAALTNAPNQLIAVRPGAFVTSRSAARKSIEAFAKRAFRGPVEGSEIDALLSLYEQQARKGMRFEDAMKTPLRAVLVSPNFLFRIESDREVSGPYRITDYELANRLSYFIWASMPDAELLRAAADGDLHEESVLRRETERMLSDPKAHALSDNFAGQWLGIRNLRTTAQPDPGRFPTYTASLRDAMYSESVEFFNSLIQDNCSILTLLDANYTYLNEELAKHYGILDVHGTNLTRVALSDPNRGGILGMASILTLTSYPQRTSPVLRGKWVLEEVLGAPSPPPPPNAGGLPADDAPKEGMTFRQRLEKHRSKPECASCHKRMDPIGFGLENFDAIGRWRADIGGKAIDSSGVLVTGEKFHGPQELKKLMLAQADDFVRTLSEKMLAYALGRGVEYYDAPAVKQISDELRADRYRMRTLILGICKSFPFQYRRNQPLETAQK